jgi:hypothetical protein
VAFEGEDWRWVRRLDVVELDAVVARCGKEALVWRYAKAIYLRVGRRNGSRADTRESFPKPVKDIRCKQKFTTTKMQQRAEPYRMIIASYLDMLAPTLEVETKLAYPCTELRSYWVSIAGLGYHEETKKEKLS